MSLRPPPSAPAPSPPASSPPATRPAGVVLAGGLGLVAPALAAIIVLGLDLSGAADRPLHRMTISAYVYSHPWLFNGALALLVVGSAGVLAGLALHRWVHPLRPAAWPFWGWIACMVAVGVFPKQDWAQAVNVAGVVHRWAAFLGFVLLPVAVATVTRGAWRPGGSLWGRSAGLAALTSAGVLGYVAWAVATASGRWWRAFDLGTVERLVVGLDVLALVLLAGWVLTHRESRAG